MKISDRVNKSAAPAALLLLLLASTPAQSAGPNAEDLYNKAHEENANLQTRNAALLHINQALALDSSNSSYWHQKGMILSMQDEQEAALPCLEKSVKLDPKNALAWISYSTTLEALGHYSQAFAAVDRAQKLGDSAEVRITRAALFAKLEKYDAAEKELETAVKLDTKGLVAHIRLPAVSTKLGHWDKVIAEQNYLIPLNRKNSFHLVENLKSRANAYTQLKQYDKAIADYETALKAHPDMRQLHAGLLETYKLKGDAAGIKSETGKLQSIDDDLGPPKKDPRR